MRIPHSRPSINEEDINKVVSNLRTGKISSGEEVKLFEQEISKYIGVLGGIGVNSGTNALHLALNALGIKPGDEIILPSYVCASVLSAINYTGAKPVFADIEPKGYNIDPESAANKISKNTKAIIVPHMFGTPANLDKFLELNVPIIEDCAQAIGAEYKGKKVGSFGILSICSFYATKVLTTGQGGMVLTNSNKLLEKLRDLTKYDGRMDYRISYNYSLTDFQAAMGRSQLKRLASFINRRREIAKIYDNTFKEIGLIPPKVENSIYFRYVVEVDDVDQYIEEMNKLNIDCAKPVFKPLHQYFNMKDEEFPNTERAQNKAISIPIYPSLKDNEIKQICEAIKKVWNKF